MKKPEPMCANCTGLDPPDPLPSGAWAHPECVVMMRKELAEAQDKVAHLSALLDRGADGRDECSICRRRHGAEVRHACE